ncbi:SIS domain-containing protein [Polynucleobacter paneuropaeus]|jgi:arabinose-5-phosphate isomerase|uniref:KpsF/GutQ family sugar-phosphate isomerase n=1 Tax=Polynucleobacter paneuropaeus TaxID=2527775 RepID=A0A2Z4JU57_9BURK|nr:KpsF/GutQ family sugar-phosphate isomerase [Polynucleobacter paneuropaeus]AWW45046.1 KpsF/GutQ family sugar-phosphate isomerase [Polynucleobacter paneuropaeus]AWW46845.1 KpsF/GutQ family sugar-phosphate isomerase [Polynucleobacter paneuropaeus]AWW48580.1 KpsF/GutQ family sugar-phosphate isomerase [Polynucleobacter paneuropaeus]AWW50415.1 KpsF/GutQ family sugar-phosphate isomerase [Polynucleobacter paneuropaeus]MBT8517621.1 KpsF/GutQ family sugar-phosphate isomerase [Polynucleobacter paneuro
MIAKTRERTLKLARDTLTIEAAALQNMRDRLEGANADALVHAVELLHACKGRIVVSGIGKSGHIARKIAATFASTGSPAFFVHPAEASHGDLGMVTRDDVFVALSNSGETEELLTIVPIVKRTGAKLIALTGAPESALAKLADAHLDTSVEKEACPLNLAPTSSTTASLAMGDALAVALLDARGFQAEDFLRSHPGGRLGRKLLAHVSEVMRSFEDTPKIQIDASFKAALLEMTAKRMGMVVTIDQNQKVIGILTDGDLRRLLEKNVDLASIALKDAITSAPRTIPPELLAEEAIEMMEKHRINHLVVSDANGILLGALNLHDLFAAKVI